MPDIRAIPPADLLIDAENPRLTRPNAPQRDAFREMAKYQGRKLLALAKDIQRRGLNPSESMIVMPLNDDRKRFIVLEGNRRLTALKALENPELLVGAADRGVLDGIRQLSREYQDNPIEVVQCL